MFYNSRHKVAVLKDAIVKDPFQTLQRKYQKGQQACKVVTCHPIFIDDNLPA